MEKGQTLRRKRLLEKVKDAHNQGERVSPTKFRLYLRTFQTEAETRLWALLRFGCGGYSFRRQVIIGPYFVDFCCRKQKVAIEIDGHIHEMQKDYDKVRGRFIEEYGFKVLRFTNTEVLNDPESVVKRIVSACGRKPTWRRRYNKRVSVL